MESAKDLAARSWFGYGRWDAPYWFIGMEPGGSDDVASYESWQRLGGGELIDCRQHHLDSGFMKWHGDDQHGTQPTWRRLIQTMLAFEGLPARLDDVLRYQHDGWGCMSDDTAVIELGALHAPSLGAEVDRTTFRGERVAILRERLLEHPPIFALCYGYGFRKQFERVVGAVFDIDGFAWCGKTLCVLAPGPTSHLHGKPTPWASADWWIALGQRMSAIVATRSM
jgi:hypothetical protein